MCQIEIFKRLAEIREMVNLQTISFPTQERAREIREKIDELIRDLLKVNGYNIGEEERPNG